LRPCCEVSHLSRFDGDSLYSEGVICKRLQVGYKLSLEKILFHSSLVYTIVHLLAGFDIVDSDGVKPHNPARIDRILPREINVHI